MKLTVTNRRRSHLLPAQLVLALLVVLTGATSQIAFGQPVTAVAELSGIKQEARDLIDSLEEAGKRNTQEIAISISAIIDRLEALVGDKLTRPLDEFNETVRQEFAATRHMLDALHATVRGLPACSAAQAQLVLAGISAGVQSAVDSFPLSKGKAIAYLIEDPVRALPYRVEIDPEDAVGTHVIVRGANLWHEGRTCGPVTAVARGLDDDSQPVELPVLHSDLQKVDLRLPADLPHGQWQIEIVGKKPSLLGCWLGSKEESVAAGLLVHPPFEAQVAVDVAPVCPTVDTYNERFSGGLNNGGYNDSYERDSRTLTFSRPGYRLTHFDFDITRNRRGGATTSRSNNSVVVRYQARGRGHLGQRSTGRIYWTVVMHGEKPGPDRSGPVTRVPIDGLLKPGGVAEFAVGSDVKTCANPKAYVISARAADEAGELITATAPNQIDAGAQGLSGGPGLSVNFDANTLRGTVQMAAKSCGSAGNVNLQARSRPAR